MTTRLAQRPAWLASASPRRRELLGLTGLAFEVMPAHVDETPGPSEAPDDYVRRLSREKAEAVARGLPPAGASAVGALTVGALAEMQALVIGADTTVVSNGRVVGKPADAQEAQAMLIDLRGTVHQVLSAITVVDVAGGLSLTDLAETEVPMREYSDDEISSYIASGDPFDKAGGYAIQHAGFHPVEALFGCFANVVGLPLCHLTRTLRRFGIGLDGVPEACQAHLGYDCPVYQQILEASP
jgi:septum formation protein